MFRPRVIPVLLLKNKGLVKSTNFKKHRYIGDPINAVKVFNDLYADELVFLDISASLEGKCISIDFVKKVGEEANMPFAVGGGITSLNEIQQIISAGAEKVVLTSIAGKNPDFVKKAAQEFGSSTISVNIDVKKSLFRRNHIWVNAGNQRLSYSPIDFAKLMEENGAGEIIIQSIKMDGQMAGYDIETIREISEKVTIPVVALGGAGKIEDFKKAVFQGGASAVAGGSIFVYHGPRKGILINYPEKKTLQNLFYEN